MPSSVLILALRRLRAPLIYVVAVFAVGIVGLVLIPGVDAEGRTWHMTIAQALYFMAYTASTTGFGEIPHPYTDAQRLWATFMIFASVLGWAFLVGWLVALARDRAFRSAVIGARFARRVRVLAEPFYLICGFGETGSLVGRALDDLGFRFVVVDIDETRVQELDLLDLAQSAPALTGDARVPANLIAAGLTNRSCRGVIALTNDDQANLAVAMAVRLLNPKIPVLARAMNQETAANMASFDTDHIINPFATFGRYLALAIASPGASQLLRWLTGMPGWTLRPETAPPHGQWVVCGYGRFGRECVRALRKHGLEVTIIDPSAKVHDGVKSVRGVGTEAEPLRAAGIEGAVGIVAGTDDDVTNLSIVVTARQINRNLFTVVRQNLQANHALFDAFDADVTMVSSEIVAHECLARIHTPLLARFLLQAREQGEEWSDALVARLQASLGEATPEIWSVAMTALGAHALHRALLLEGATIRVGDLRRDPGNRESMLACEALYLASGETVTLLPDDEIPLAPGDALLFAGKPAARRAQLQTLRNVNVRDYVVHGIDRPGGWIWQRLTQRQAPPRAPRPGA
ncbi:MAG: NAD-binding protein [Burkholderiales bacterium]|nr:NAD-binding protein [Burkholderiales bacterium]